MRDHLESSILRHGDVKDLSAIIEMGGETSLCGFC